MPDPRKQIPALPEATTFANEDFLIKRDTQSGTDEKLSVSLLLNSTGEQVNDHATETGGVHGVPEGERALHTGTNGGGTPIGGYVTVQTDLTGAEEPDPETHIKLEAGLTGTGEYNEGKLGSESVTGSAPLVEATAEIVDAESPLNGQIVHLLETERRFLRAGLAGTVENDQMQRIMGSISFVNRVDGLIIAQNQSGAFGLIGATVGGNDSNGQIQRTSGTFPMSATRFNSASSPDARASSTTDGETRAKNIGVSVYMRIR